MSKGDSFLGATNDQISRIFLTHLCRRLRGHGWSGLVDLVDLERRIVDQGAYAACFVPGGLCG